MRYAPVRKEAAHSTVNPPLSAALGQHSQRRALDLLRAGNDTQKIAWLLACTEAAAYNAIHAARLAEGQRR